MLIEMQSGVAWEMARTAYAEASKPLSFLGRRDGPTSVTWWTSSPRRESIEHSRKRDALGLYLALARRAQTPLTEFEFPAEFHFLDHVSLRPDKGVIKACLVSRPAMLETSLRGAELIFQVTPSARSSLPNHQTTWHNEGTLRGD